MAGENNPYDEEQVRRIADNLFRLEQEANKSAEAQRAYAQALSGANELVIKELEIRRQANAIQESGVKAFEQLKSAIKGLDSALLDTTNNFKKYTYGIESLGKGAAKTVENFGMLGWATSKLIGGLTAFTGKVLEQTDNIVKAYDEMAKVGGSIGLTSLEIKELGKQAGFSTHTLSQFTKAASENSNALVAMGGSVSKGMKAFSQITAVGDEQLAQYRRLGFSQEQVLEAQSHYIKNQQMAGASLAKSPKELQKASLEYIDSLVKLAELTGADVKKQQEALDYAAAQENFNAYKFSREREREEALARGDKVTADRIANELKAKEEFIRGTANYSQKTKLALLESISGTTPVITENTAFLKNAGINIEGIAKNLNNGQSQVTAFNAENARAQDRLRRQYGDSLTRYGSYSRELQGITGADNEGRREAMKYQKSLTEAGRKELEAEEKIAAKKEEEKKKAADAAIEAEKTRAELERDFRKLVDGLLDVINPLTSTTGKVIFALGGLAAIAGTVGTALLALRAVGGFKSLMQVMGPNGRGSPLNPMHVVMGPAGGGIYDALRKKGVPAKEAYKQSKAMSALGGLTGQFGNVAASGVTGAASKAAIPVATTVAGTAGATAAGAAGTAGATAAGAAGASGLLKGAASTLGKLAGPLAGVMSVFSGVMTAKEGLDEVNDKVAKGELTKEEATTKKSEAVGKGTGQAAGGIGGAIAGAALGTAIFPVVGTAIGAAIGGWLGSKGGEVVGEKIGEKVGKNIASSKDDKKDEKPAKDDNAKAQEEKQDREKFVQKVSIVKPDPLKVEIAKFSLDKLKELMTGGTGMPQIPPPPPSPTAPTASPTPSPETPANTPVTTPNVPTGPTPPVPSAPPVPGAGGGRGSVNPPMAVPPPPTVAPPIMANVPIKQDVAQNLGFVKASMMKRGEKDENYINAVLANVMKETGGRRVEENLDYGGTSNERIRSIFGDRAKGKSDAELDKIKGNPQMMAEMMYGSTTSMGQNMGNKEPGDGWKYRGRGYIGLTGKANYLKASQAIFGDDTLVKNPELVNDPKYASEIVAWYMQTTKGAIKKQMGMGEGPMSKDQANLLATSQVAGKLITPGKGYLGTELLSKVDKFSTQVAGVKPTTGDTQVASAPVKGQIQTSYGTGLVDSSGNPVMSAHAVTPDTSNRSKPTDTRVAAATPTPTRAYGESSRPPSGSHADEGGNPAPTVAATTVAGTSKKYANGLEQANAEGLKLRPYGDVADGLMTDSALRIAKDIQNTVPNFGMYTGLNDAYHKVKHPRSRHAIGQGMDFSLSKFPTPDEAQNTVDMIKKMTGIHLIKDEYYYPQGTGKEPSRPGGGRDIHTTGPHFHAQVSAAAEGVASGPQTGYPATLHGTELIKRITKDSILDKLAHTPYQETSENAAENSSKLESLLEELKSLQTQTNMLLDSKLGEMITYGSKSVEVQESLYRSSVM